MAIWSLGLARYVGENTASSLSLGLGLYTDPLVVGLSGIAGAGGGLLIARALRGTIAQTGWIPLLLPLLYLLTPRPAPLMGITLLAGGAGLTFVSLLVPPADKQKSEDRPALLTTIVLAAVVLGLYLRTMGRSVGEADTFEFQVVAPALGIAHPTGYPLYILLGKLFSLLPFGSTAWRVNLTSVVFTTGAVVLFHRLLLKLTQAPLASLLTSLALALSRSLWSQSIVAEVYGLNLLFVTGILSLAFPLLADQRPAGREKRREVWGLAFLLGLSLTNHLTMILLLPALGLALLLGRPQMDRRDWALCPALFLLGLSIYAYIPLRWPALHDGQAMGLGEFLAYVTGRQFSGALQPALLRDPTRYAIVGRLLMEPFGLPGILLAAVGVGTLGWRRWQRRLGMVSGAAFLAYVLYGLVYRVPDLSVFLLPAHLLLALWMGIGVTALVRPRLTVVHRRWPALASSVLLTLFAWMPLGHVWINLLAVDQSGRVASEQWGRYVLGLPLAPKAAVLADSEKFPPLYYLQQVEGMRPDLDLVVHFTEESYHTDLATRLSAGQTVYLARYLPHIATFYLRSLGPLVEVGTAPSTEPPAGVTPSHAVFGSEVELLAYTLEDDPQGRPLRHLTLYWRALEPSRQNPTPRLDLEVQLRLVDAAGQAVWRSDAGRPVGGNYPTSSWSPGTVVADYHPIPIPAWLSPGNYGLEVGLFPRFSEEGLAVRGTETTWWELMRGHWQPGEPTGDPPYRTQMLLGTNRLVGYDLPATVPAGTPVEVELAWDRAAGGVVRLEWLDEGGRSVEGSIGKAEFVLPAGATRSRVQMAAPDEAGDYLLQVMETGQKSHCRWLAPPTSACELAAVTVTPASTGLADFGGQMLLIAAEVGAEQLRPGDVLPVTLYWRALREIALDYTVTIQLIGPDGRLHGQVDAWPVQGTLPTSAWDTGAGNEIRDPYQVVLSPDAPPGRYQVVVGVYLLATMERLPVVQDGVRISDHQVIGEVVVIPFTGASGSGRAPTEPDRSSRCNALVKCIAPFVEVQRTCQVHRTVRRGATHLSSASHLFCRARLIAPIRERRYLQNSPKVLLHAGRYQW